MTYLLFGGSDYYPAGGADDFVGAFPSIEDAKAFFAQHPQDWAHIAVFEDNQFRLVCAFGVSGDTQRSNVTAWHDCTDR